MNRELMLIVYALMALWTFFSTYYIFRLWKIKNISKNNPYLYNSIPSIFTTLGVLGTFVGIFFGLQKFDVNNITESIPTLLEGMKTAFLTSIIGIILSLIFRTIGQLVLRTVELKEAEHPKPTNELVELGKIVKILSETKTETNSNLKLLNSALVGNTDTSISTLLIKLNKQIISNNEAQTKQNEILNKIQVSLSEDEETSLLIQLEKLRSQLDNNIVEQKAILGKIDNSITDTKEKISKKLNDIDNNNKDRHNSLLNKFDKFGEILKENNTKALVEVMQQATETFNAQMSELIERLVKENFEELNNSVQRLNNWQQENKEMIATLTEQFKKVSKQFEISATSIKEITENTVKLTDKNSFLAKLIQELQKVMIEDTKYQDIINKLTSTIEILKENTETFDETTNKLNNWIINEKNFHTEILLLLDELKKLRAYDGEFWDKTKEKLDEGISIISNASKELRNNLDNISEEFTEQLTQTLKSLDELIQRLAGKYYQNQNEIVSKSKTIKQNIFDDNDELPFY
jgi:predicted HAD superfamily phosphohydrolase